MSLVADVGDSAALPELPPERPSGSAVVEQLRALAQGECPEEALEAALRLIIGAAGAGAGALCLFDARQETLRLAAEQGLSDAGCKMVRSIRRGDGESWDMPLRSLLNNRAYLVENSRRGKHVPFLVEGPPHTTVVACIPLYAESFPLGSLLLLAIDPGTLKHADVQALAAPLRELATLVQALRRRGDGERARGAPSPDGRAEPDVGRLREALAAAEATASVREAERLRLEDELAAARAQTEDARKRADQLLAVVQTLRRQYDATQTPGPERATPGEEPIAELLRAARADAEGVASLTANGHATSPATPEAASLDGPPTPTGVAATPPATAGSPPPALSAGATPTVRPAGASLAAPAPSASPARAKPPETPARAATPPPVATPREFDAVVLDQGDAWTAHAPEGSRMLALAPEASGDDLRSRSASRLIVNLAAPGTLEALGQLATSGVYDEAWGCVARPDRDGVLHVGRLQPVCYPVDPEAVAASFERNQVGGAARVLAVASNVDTVLALRKALSDRGASVSIAWSAKQALDLIPMLRPQIAIIELAVTLREGAEAVILLARSERPPTFVFLPGQADASRAFTLQLTLPANAELLVPRKRWLARILRGDGTPR